MAIKIADTESWRTVALVSIAALTFGSVAASMPVVYRSTSRRLSAAGIVERDDADAVVRAFGAPESDHVRQQTDPLAALRFLAYRRRQVQIAFMRRLVGNPPRLVWKLVGFSDLAGRQALTGDEAFKRLSSR